MDSLILHTITLLHIIFLIFIIITPFSNSNYFLLVHSIIVPFLLLHWITNNNTCALTAIERFYRRKKYKNKYKDEDCFTCRLIEPIYDLNKSENLSNIFLYAITISLGTYSSFKLYKKYKSGKINNIKDFFLM